MSIKSGQTTFAIESGYPATLQEVILALREMPIPAEAQFIQVDGIRISEVNERNPESGRYEGIGVYELIVDWRTKLHDD